MRNFIGEQYKDWAGKTPSGYSEIMERVKWNKETAKDRAEKLKERVSHAVQYAGLFEIFDRPSQFKCVGSFPSGYTLIYEADPYAFMFKERNGFLTAVRFDDDYGCQNQTYFIFYENKWFRTKQQQTIPFTVKCYSRRTSEDRLFFAKWGGPVDRDLYIVDVQHTGRLATIHCSFDDRKMISDMDPEHQARVYKEIVRRLYGNVIINELRNWHPHIHLQDIVKVASLEDMPVDDFREIIDKLVTMSTRRRCYYI